MIYLDNASTTLKKPPCVIKSMTKLTKQLSANSGRGGHYYSREASMRILDASQALASFFNISSPEQIAFTNNATTALNFAINGFLQNGGHVICTALEHNSVMRPLHRTENVTCTVVEPDKSGIVDPKRIEDAIQPDTCLIICTHASNVFGTIQPIKQIGKICKNHGIVFLADAAQTAGSVDIDVKDMNIDMLAFSGHKGLMGPMGTGGLYVSENVRLVPVITGGTGSFSESLEQPDFMPDMLQSGTLNTPAVASLESAVNFINSVGIDYIYSHETSLAKLLFDGLKNIPSVTVYATDDFTKRNGTVSFNIAGIDAVSVSQELDEKYGIAVRAGYHCAYSAHKCMGTHDGGTVRASVGFYNNQADIDKLLHAVSQIAKHA